MTLPESPIKLPAHIRAARRDDAPALAFLINEAGEGLPAHFWSRNDQGLSPWEYGLQRAAREQGDFSYRNAHVVERDGVVLAMLLGFVIAPAELDPDQIPEIVRPLALLEQQAAGSWYINALATRPGSRGQGIGIQLIGLAHALALAAGCKAVSLQNFTSNVRARSLYQRVGFVEVARMSMPGTALRDAGLPDFGETILHVMPVSKALAAPYRSTNLPA
jgi:ribosomal protein S18 acetylase RimI-like enzyme